MFIWYLLPVSLGSQRTGASQELAPVKGIGVV